jgi:hypothetical protein
MRIGTLARVEIVEFVPALDPGNSAIAPVLALIVIKAGRDDVLMSFIRRGAGDRTRY